MLKYLMRSVNVEFYVHRAFLNSRSAASARRLRPWVGPAMTGAQIAVGFATKTSPHAFSWLSTKKVCQRWAAFYAALPNQLESNVV
jgi:hypothetical protein